MAAQSTRPLDLQDLDRVVDLVGEASWEGLRGVRLFMTGGTGFVGKWLLSTLNRARERFALGCSTTVLSRDPDAFRRDVPFLAQAAGTDLLTGDIRDYALPDGRFEMIVHAATDVVAAASPLEVFDACAAGTRRVLDHARSAGAQRVLLISSGAVYGTQPASGGVDERYSGAPDLGDLRSAYGEGKRVSEWLGSAYAQLFGLDVRAARLFAFLGPYLPLDKHYAAGNILREAMAGRAIELQGDGTALRTYLHATDMSASLWAILLRGTKCGTYNVGGDEVVSVAELARRVAALLGSSNAEVHLKRQPQASMAPNRYVPDTSKARSELGLGAPLGLDEAIVRTAAWHCAASFPSKETKHAS